MSSPESTKGRERSHSVGSAIRTAVTSNDIINNGWNGTQERLWQRRGEEALGLQLMHIEASILMRWWYTFWTILNIFLSGITGMAILGNYACETEWINLTLGFLAFGTAFITGMLNQLRLSENADAHKKSSSDFADLGEEIQNTLALRRIDRSPGMAYMKVIQKKYNAAKREALELPKKIRQDYSKLAEKTGVNLPDIAGGIEPIQIKGKQPSPVSTKMTDNKLMQSALQLWRHTSILGDEVELEKSSSPVSN